MSKYYDEVVGQDHAKNRLKFYIDGFKESNIFPHVLFIAPKGIGKTMFARETGGVLKDIVAVDGKKKHFIEINSSTVKNVRQFIEQIVMNYVHEQDATLFFDEIHELNPKLVAALLSILNPNKQNRTEFRFGDMVFEFDFRRVTFIGATTERQKMFAPLLDRMTEVHLVDYDLNEVAKIIRKNLDDKFTIEDDALLEMAKYCRGNGRSAAVMGGHQGISNYMASTRKRVFKMEDSEKLVKILDLFPLGFTRMEVDILRSIAEKNASSLTMLSAKSGLSKAAQQDIEKAFLKYGFIDIEVGHGRSITSKGQQYLKSVEGR